MHFPRTLLFLAFSLVSGTIVRAASSSESVVFKEICDASAIVSVTDDLFAVANDEDNLLRFYRWNRPGSPVYTSQLNAMFFGKKKAPEMDIEATARLGQQIFWITSHGRNRKGKAAPERCGFFALEISESNGEIILRQTGKLYTHLLDDLFREPKLATFDLANAAKLAPKARGGLNIEALAATPSGELLIGFRNPIPQGRALIVPLLNPEDLLSGKRARFGDAILLELNGLGLRGMESVEGGYYLIAGPADGGGVSQLFFWKGDESKPQPVTDIHFPGLNPEGICVVNGSQSELILLSDDGAREVNGKECKDLPKSQRQFRALRVTR